MHKQLLHQIKQNFHYFVFQNVQDSLQNTLEYCVNATPKKVCVDNSLMERGKHQYLYVVESKYLVGFKILVEVLKFKKRLQIYLHIMLQKLNFNFGRQIHGIQLMKHLLQYYSNENGIALCGAYLNQFDWRESIVNYEIDTQHSLPQVKIVLRSTLDEGAENESWGVRDFQLFAATCQKGCKICTNTKCQECFKGYELQSGLCTQNDFKWLNNNKFFFNDQNSEGWQTIGVFQNSNELFTLYQGQYIFGGQSKFGQDTKVQRNFNLPKHTLIRIQFTFYTFKSLNNDFNDFLQIFIDGILIYEYQILNYSEQVPIDVITPHSNERVTIVINTTQQIGADINSWGFSEFSLLYDFVEECIELYTQCNFQGDKYELCRKQEQGNNVIILNKQFTQNQIDQGAERRECYNQQKSIFMQQLMFQLKPKYLIE